MKKPKSPNPTVRKSSSAARPQIVLISGQRVIIDSDLANLYGVKTKRLKEQVKRNCERFPTDFLLQLTETEASEVVAKYDHLKNLKFASTLPLAFTEHGAIRNLLASKIHEPDQADSPFFDTAKYAQVPPVYPRQPTREA
jgi:hypothetical protein